MNTPLTKLCCQVNPQLTCVYCAEPICEPCMLKDLVGGAHAQHKEQAHGGRLCGASCCSIKEGHLYSNYSYTV